MRHLRGEVDNMEDHQNMARTFSTSVGILQALRTYETYPDGTLRACILDDEVTILTPVGELVPRYTDEGVRRKYNHSLSFFPSGKLKAIALHERVPIMTSQGEILAEHIVFYETGELHRVFPCNGRISGYWTQEDEQMLSRPHTVSWADQSLTARIMIFRFYTSGSLRSLTLWPGENCTVQTPLGEMNCRIGISFYENGAMQSIEPLAPVRVSLTSCSPASAAAERLQKKDGFAYDCDATGLHGDSNSLRFSPEGKVISFVADGERTMPMLDLCGDCSSCASASECKK